MKAALARLLAFVTVPSVLLIASPCAGADVRAWEDTIAIPTYQWQEDPNPQFWVIRSDSANKINHAITYPYVMQDHITRRKEDRTYKALLLENEYLRVTCLPELGGRLHSVFDKSTRQEMFHLNHVIKPGMIAMRGAFISGGVEWNTGPQGHTVTILAPVDALLGHNPDGSAYIEIANQEQIFRTRWTVRVTLHPGRAYLDEQIRLYNPTDGTHPYYFWNCTAFPHNSSTRFIYPMTLGTDHFGREFFRWPVDKGRDLSWLKNYETYASVFAVHCSYDFFGAYDVGADRGIVQTANHHQVPGKKAWTWGEWDFGKVAEQNLTDTDGRYIEVQSGPLPTQSDYGMLGPRERVAWQEWWYPVHGLGDGFEYATRDLVVQTARRDGRLEVRLLATGRFPQATCVLARAGGPVVLKQLDLSPLAPATVTFPDVAQRPPEPIEVTVTSQEDRVLAAFTTPLPIPKVEPPDPATFAEKPDDEMSVEQLYLMGRKLDRSTDRLKARDYYAKALARDEGHVASLRALAVLDFEAGFYVQSIGRLEKALARDGDDGLCWFYLGACQLRLRNQHEALACGYRAARCSGTVAIGFDLVGRVLMQLKDRAGAVVAFQNAVRANGNDPLATDHLMLALHAAERASEAWTLAERRIAADPTALLPRALLALQNELALGQFAQEVRGFVGEKEFEILETSLSFAELGLIEEAQRLVEAVCRSRVPAAEQDFMPLYYLAWYAAQRGDAAAAERWLKQAASTVKPYVFASRPEEVEILEYAVKQNPADAQAHLQLGCLLANLGRVAEAVSSWRQAVALDDQLSIAWRNLGLVAAGMKDDPARAEECYRKAITAQPDDQTLYRDLAQIFVAAGKRADAIRLLEEMPSDGVRRGEITVLLAESYIDAGRYGDCITLLESTPCFINWEGQNPTWRLFNQAHIERGRQRLQEGDVNGALGDFEAALTYPANLNVGRSNKPKEAPAQYWRGKALAALGRLDEARAAWQAGAAGTVAVSDAIGEHQSRAQGEYRQKCRDALAGKDL